jgi:hypothetical protein
MGYDDKRPAAYNILPAPAELPLRYLECQIGADQVASSAPSRANAARSRGRDFTHDDGRGSSAPSGEVARYDKFAQSQ